MISLEKVSIQHFIQHVPKLKQISNQLHFELVHTIAEGGMGMLHEAKQMGTGHSSQRAEIKLIRGSMPTAREVFIRAISYRPTNVKLASYIKDLFGNNSSSAAKRWALSEAPGLEQDEEA